MSFSAVASPLPFFSSTASVLFSLYRPLKLHHPPRKRLLLRRRRRRLKSPAASAVDSASPRPRGEAAYKLQQWSVMTARFAGASNVPFLLIQIPQILLNYRNLVSGNSSALFAVPWLARTGKLPEKTSRFVGSISGWTATLLFMWMPISQMWTNYLNPQNIKGLSALTLLLGMIGNGLMIPRALFIRDLMWFTGASWASLLQGWGNLAWMYCLKSISREFFWMLTVGLLIWLGMAARQDTIAYGCSSPFQSLKELFSGT